jgi:hypothetical protein
LRFGESKEPAGRHLEKLKLRERKCEKRLSVRV